MKSRLLWGLFLVLLSIAPAALAESKVAVTLAERMVGPPGKEEYANHPDAKPAGVTTAFKWKDSASKMWIYCAFTPPFADGRRWTVSINRLVDLKEEYWTKPQFTTMGGDKAGWTDVGVPSIPGSYVLRLMDDNEKVYATVSFTVAK